MFGTTLRMSSGKELSVKTDLSIIFLYFSSIILDLVEVIYLLMMYSSLIYKRKQREQEQNKLYVVLLVICQHQAQCLCPC